MASNDLNNENSFLHWPREVKTMKQSRFPKGWDEDRVKRVLTHYESQTEEEAMGEDEAVWEDSSQTFMEIPNDLLPAVRKLLAKSAEKVSSKANKENI